MGVKGITTENRTIFIKLLDLLLITTVGKYISIDFYK